MSHRATLKDKAIVKKLVKDLNKRIEDLITCVEDIKIISETAEETHDTVVNQEIINEEKIKKLNEDLKENRKKTLYEAAKKDGKVLISDEDLQELHNTINKLKTEKEELLSDNNEDVSNKVNLAIKNKLELQKLEFECIKATLEAKLQSSQAENKSLEAAIKRMSEELESQKTLTSNLALAQRPISAPINKN